MDKNLIKKHLFDTFLKEDATPGISVTNAAKKKSEKVNKDGVNAIDKDIKNYDKALKQTDKGKNNMAINKYNYTDDAEKQYHDEMEILNGQEMVEYTSEPGAEFKKRAEEGILGSSRMGNEKGGNAEETWNASSDDFGKNLVKRIKDSSKKRADAEIQTYGMGDVQIPTGRKVQTATTAIASGKPKGDVTKVNQSASEKPKTKVVNEGLSDKNIKVLTNWVGKYGAKEAAEKLINHLSDTGMISDLPDTEQYGSGLNKVTKYLQDSKFDVAYQVARKLASSLEKKAMKDMMGETDEPKKVTEISKELSGKAANKAYNNYIDAKDNDLDRSKFGNQADLFKNYVDPTIKSQIEKRLNGKLTSDGNEYTIILTNGLTNSIVKITGTSIKTDENLRQCLQDSGIRILTNIAKKLQNTLQHTQIKENMKRLKFKKPFNGFGNALKLIPENYRVNNKEFEMTDGNESYRIRWEGNLNEGKGVILSAENKGLVKEEMDRIKNLFNYKSQDTLGLVKGSKRVDENKIFSEIWSKTKAMLSESDDIEDETPATGDLDNAVKSAPEAKKHIEGSVSTDKGTQAPKPKTGSMESIDSAKSQAKEAKKHVEGSVSTDKGTQAGKPKIGVWDEISVPHAAEAKKHIESGNPTNMSTDTAKVVKENEEMDDEKEDNYYNSDSDDSSSVSEPTDTSDTGTAELPFDDVPDAGGEDRVIVPNPSKLKKFRSQSTNQLYILKDGKHILIPVELEALAMQNPEKALAKMQNDADMNDDEMDTY